VGASQTPRRLLVLARTGHIHLSLFFSGAADPPRHHPDDKSLGPILSGLGRVAATHLRHTDAPWAKARTGNSGAPPRRARTVGVALRAGLLRAPLTLRLPEVRPLRALHIPNAGFSR